MLTQRRVTDTKTKDINADADSVRSTVVAYYNAWESRIGYRLLLGGARHFGYYPSEDSWPWPVDRPLRAMEGKLLEGLRCQRGARVLDAGCGVGVVALFMAREGGLRVEAIDFTPHHVVKARRNVELAKLQDQISVRLGDYHDLSFLGDAEMDGVFASECLCHATDPRQVLREFFRVLKPGGRVTIHDFDGEPDLTPLTQIIPMPMVHALGPNGLEGALQEAGFQDVQLTDMSKNVLPMVRLFVVLGYIPYLVVTILGLQRYFPNVMIAICIWRLRDHSRYIQVTATKPE